ncbi:MAG: polysaccharide deacetylase family protein [Chloroflexota bacterium]
MKRQALLNLLYQSGSLQLVRRYWGKKALTVLAYHRIVDPTPDFDTFAPNISATPADFERQMAFVAKWFNVVRMEDVVAWLKNGRSLPPYPALITFDDGYRDNLTHAFPILQKYNLPATIFLATDYIGKQSPFFWDLAAYCFHHTKHSEVNLPFLGKQQWANPDEREAVMSAWLGQLKAILEEEKWTAVSQLPSLLGVAIPDNAFAQLTLSWDEVCHLQQHNIHMGAHTHTHPILTRLAPEQAEQEIITSKREIETRTGQLVISFAYPNGLTDDYAPIHATYLQQANIPLAFTLAPAPAYLSEIQQAPHTIRRILIDRHDTFPRFAAKVTGLTRLAGIPQ